MWYVCVVSVESVCVWREYVECSGSIFNVYERGEVNTLSLENKGR